MKAVADNSLRQALVPVWGGMAGLAVAMGIGRFAYTPLLPVMQEEFRFSSSFAGYLASWNYLGYLIGAVVAGWLSPILQRHPRYSYRMIMAALAGSVGTTELMAFTESHGLWSILRGLSGMCSAGVLVLSSALVMEWLTIRKRTNWIGVLYAGVGMGITFTGVLVPVFRRFGGWRLGWQGLGALGLLLVIEGWLAMRPMRNMPHSVRQTEPVPASKAAGKPPFRLWGVMVAYGLEGLGYIVMATFITAFFRLESRFPWLGDVSWVLVGLAAVPSTWLWTRAADRFGWRAALYAAFISQAIGVLLPAIRPGLATAIIGSVLFGGTFMGITTLALSIGRQCAPEQPGRVIGNLTAVFGAGQIVGPLVAGWIAEATHRYNFAMLLSGLVLLAATIILWLAGSEPSGTRGKQAHGPSGQ